MADSTNAVDIPVGRYELVAGYVDGDYAWTASEWGRHAAASDLVRITVTGATLDAHVADVERYDLSPAQGVDWAVRMLAAGRYPTLYASLSVWGSILDDYRARGVDSGRTGAWVAAWNGTPNLESGWLAHQYANSVMVGAHYDLSVVADYWPGVDALPAPPAYQGGGGAISGWAGLQSLIGSDLPAFASELGVLSSGLDSLG